MAAKGLDAGGKVLAKAIGNQLIHALRMQSQRGKIVRDGKRHGVSVWPSATVRIAALAARRE
jgi:hypothetical protein